MIDDRTADASSSEFCHPDMVVPRHVDRWAVLDGSTDLPWRIRVCLGCLDLVDGLNADVGHDSGSHSERLIGAARRFDIGNSSSDRSRTRKNL
jgi:hypothetical protein